MEKKILNSYENTDGENCVQCVLRSIFEYFESEKDWTWEELRQLTGKKPGKLPWAYRRQINIAKRGYDAVLISSSKIQDYVQLGVYPAMVKNSGVDFANYQSERADIDQINKDVQEYWQLVTEGKLKHLERLPTIKDIQEFLEKGYLLASSLNSRKLAGNEGHSPHLVLVHGMDETHVHIQDSNIPIKENNRIEINKFLDVCTDPSPQQWSLYAYKKI